MNLNESSFEGTSLDSEGLQHKIPDPVPGQKTVAPKLHLERRQVLERKIQSNPDDQEAFLELAQIYREEQRPLEAKRVLQQGRKIFPDDLALLWQWEEAVLARSIQQFREANDLASRVNSAEADRELERGQENWIQTRIDICRGRLERDPSAVQYCVVLAEALLDGGKFDDAIKEAEPALASDEYAPPAFLIQGRSFLAIGKHAEAMKALRSASMRRAVPAPIKIRIAGLRLLCEAASHLGVTESHRYYEALLKTAEAELSNQ